MLSRYVATAILLCSELNSKSYLLQGGTVIYGNSNLNDDKYKVPGNYYCNSTEAAASLQNAPFSVAFTLKVEQATGSSEYPCQTARNYQTGAKAWREYNPYSKMWTNWIYFSNDATVLSQAIKCKTFYNDTAKAKQFPTTISVNAIIFAFDTQNILSAAITSFNTNQGSRITYTGNSNTLVESFSVRQITLAPNVFARVYDV